MVESDSATLASVAIEAISHIGLRCPLPELVRNSVSGSVLFNLVLYMFIK